MKTNIHPQFYLQLHEIAPLKDEQYTLIVDVYPQSAAKKKRLDLPVTREHVVDDIMVQVTARTGLTKPQINRLEIIGCEKAKKKQKKTPEQH